jgi:hypothetical protein
MFSGEENNRKREDIIKLYNLFSSGYTPNAISKLGIFDIKESEINEIYKRWLKERKEIKEILEK